jgi:protein TonB
MRGFLVSLGVHAAGVSALLSLPAFSASDLPPVPKPPPVSLPRFTPMVTVARHPPLVTAAPRRSGGLAATEPRESAPQARPTISDAPLDPDRKDGSVLDSDIQPDWSGTSPQGDRPGILGLSPGPDTGGPEPTRLVRANIEVQPPRRLSGPEPVYPPIAVATRQQGRVVLECTIDANGRVVDIRVLHGHPLFDSAAVAAVERWAYKPTLLNGVPVSVLMTVTVDFHLR